MSEGNDVKGKQTTLRRVSGKSSILSTSECNMSVFQYRVARKQEKWRRESSIEGIWGPDSYSLETIFQMMTVRPTPPVPKFEESPQTSKSAGYSSPGSSKARPRSCPRPDPSLRSSTRTRTGPIPRSSSCSSCSKTGSMSGPSPMIFKAAASSSTPATSMFRGKN